MWKRIGKEENRLLLASVKLLEWIRLCCRFLTRWAGIKLLLEPLGVHAPVIIQNVCVPLCHHGRLGVSSIALNALDVAAAEHQLVCGAGVADTVEYHFRQVIIGDQLIEHRLMVEPSVGVPDEDAKTRS